MNDAIVSVQRRLITERVFLLLEAELLDFCKLIFYPERLLPWVSISFPASPAAVKLFTLFGWF
jgi:hypothetical protein